MPISTPERLLQQGRAIDPEFAPGESLYLRYSPQIEATEDLPASAMAIRFPDFSVNRGKYSEPEDVLIPNWPDFGIAAFRVRDVPTSVSGRGIVYEFKVEHDPLELNYAHSEVRTYKDGKRRREVKLRSQRRPLGRFLAREQQYSENQSPLKPSD